MENRAAPLGCGAYTLAIPPASPLLGFELFFQCGSFDTVAVGGIALSNGIAVTVGL